MKRILCLITATFLLLSMASASLAENAAAAEYIPGAASMLTYVEPTYYENEDGPTIGVTMVGVIFQDGLYFKDSDNDQELDIFEDWRLDNATRAADLVSKMSLEQQAGMVFNMSASPSAATVDEATDENGNVLFEQVFPTIDPGWVVDREIRAGILRTSPESAVLAMYNNSMNQLSEYTSVLKHQPTIPFTTNRNPNNVGFPGGMGMAAAVMGDVSLGGDYGLITRFAEINRQIWNAEGTDVMYGPQIDLVTDPRWNRNSGTYGEVPEVVAGISAELVKGYQNGTDGAQDGDVVMMMKHFPGDGAAENGFESHNKIGEWRIYATEGSLEKYQLVGFQAAIDAGMASVMPGYSRPTADARSVPQTYRGIEIPVEEIGNGYNPAILQTLLREAMGFTGYVNSDSGIIDGSNFGAEEMTKPERVATIISAGTDVISSGFAPEAVIEAVNTGLLPKEDLDRASTNRLLSLFEMDRFENPYRDADEATRIYAEVNDEALANEANQKSVVLMKNHDSALPLNDTSKKVYIRSFTNAGRNEGTENGLIAAFEGAGFTVVDSVEDADIAYLAVAPGGVTNSGNMMNVLDLVEGLVVEERSHPTSQAKSGTTKEHTSLMDVAKIPEIAETVHANGGIVVASIRITSPWILTNLEPYCDALIGEFSTTVSAQIDVLTGAYNPTGKLPITMVSCNEVIAVNEVEIDGVVYEICVSPNDVPGYAKDEYMSAEVLAQSPSGSYAYQDADGNIYSAWFGLSY